MSDGPELRPCPFCGGKARAISPANGSGPYVMCEANFCTGPQPGIVEAYNAWNRRDPAVLAALPEVREAEQRAYIRGLENSLAMVRSMRASEGVLRGQELICSGLEINLTKARALITPDAMSALEAYRDREVAKALEGAAGAMLFVPYERALFGDDGVTRLISAGKAADAIRALIPQVKP